MRRAGILALVLLSALSRAHLADLEVDRVRILAGKDEAFLELVVRYPKNDTPLALRVVMTDRSKGVLEAKTGAGYAPVRAIPIPYGISAFGRTTRYRVRLVGGRYRPGETVPVTLLFPAGALLTLPAKVVPLGTGPPWGWLFAGLAAAAALSGAFLRIRSLRAGRRPARVR